ncbi:hypothetical protein LROSL1_1191 [Furfurilactobacillus rossiae]|uniref:hypothetical protein n=1 Tax=Furfurilactobacillus rossiae TaxID=231049 RepID=UPI0015C040BE|nr:hypothetical protein [Furfurilactobacillus rossiae]QLE64008.1 hypothetical protein LROSL1_1191 [Furfurilactobacillus rossiae]
MGYLTQDEYSKMGYDQGDANAFVTAEKAAERSINDLTHFYDPWYGLHDLTEEAGSSIPYRVHRAKVFMQAVAMQTEFVQQSGVTNGFAAATGDMKQFEIGHTQMQFNGGAGSEVTEGITGVLTSVSDLLSSVGLLYTGVDHT